MSVTPYALPDLLLSRGQHSFTLAEAEGLLECDTTVGAVVYALRELTTAIGLQERSRKIRSSMATYVCHAPAENGGVSALAERACK